MKIVITAEGMDINSSVDPRFGRAKGFIIFDDTDGSFDYSDNKQNLNAVQGAGIQSAKNIIDAGADVLITGNVGPKAFATLNSAGVEIYTGANGTVKDSIKMYRNGDLKKTGGATVDGHH